MLRYKAENTLLFQYPIPPDKVPSAQPLCDLCTTQIFNPRFSQHLITDWQSKTQRTLSYIQNGKDFRNSYILGCKWCQRIARGIYSIYVSLVMEGHEDEDPEPDFDNEDMSRFDILNHDSRFTLEIAAVAEESSERYDRLHVKCQYLDGEGDEFIERIRDENAVQLVYQIQSSLGTWVENIFDNLADYELRSESNLQSARSWVTNCSKHVVSEHWTFKPARLIDVKCHKLVESSEVPNSSGYVALSYVWGKNQAYVLKTAAFSAMKEELDNNLVSGSIADAIFVCRELGFSYLWVDALCIIQDSDDDKNRELAKMSSVYQYAALTIVAANSDSTHAGFLNKTVELDYLVKPFEIPFYTPDLQPETAVLSYVATKADKYKREKDPINSRAWTFQEQLLSAHMLVFSYDGMQKICRKEQIEGEQGCKSPAMSLAGLTSYPKIFGYNGLDFGNARKAWESIVQEYTSRQLTYGSDKLSAIAAVAEEVGRQWNGRYVAGLWTHHLERDLKWKRGVGRPGLPNNSARQRPKGYRAPSWSWASIDNLVDWVIVPDEYESFDRFEILSCRTELESTTLPYGPVRSGILEIKGVLRASTNHYLSNGILVAHFGEKDDSKGNISCELDALEPDLEAQTIYLLPMHTFMDTSSYHNPPRDQTLPKVDGLLLLTAEGGSYSSYRRIGTFVARYDMPFAGLEAQIVRIV